MVGELILVMERMNNGDVPLYGYQNQMEKACEWSHLHQWRESGDSHVEAAWIVEHVNSEDKRIVPEHENGGHDVGHKHAGQDEVGLGPESGRHPYRDERKAVAAQVDNLHNKKNGNPCNHWICLRHTPSETFCDTLCRCNVDVHADVDVSQL